MKTRHIWLIAVVALIALVAFTADASAATHLLSHGPFLIAPIAASSLEQLPELAQAFREKTEEVNLRMLTLEQAVAKGLKTANEFSPQDVQLDIGGIVQDPAFQRIKSDSRGTAHGFELGDISIKALINLGDASSGNTSHPTFATQLPGRLAQPLAPLRLINALPSRSVDSNKVEYIQLDWTGDADVQAGEGEQKAEMDFEGALVTANVATIAVHTTASAQVLDDTQALQATIQRVMTGKVLSKVEEQLVTGSGTGANIDGLYTQATVITTGEDGIPERIGKALTTMESAGYAPNVILMHPDDWFAVSILKDADGNYIYGNPASPAPASLWNRPVITSPNIPAGHALIGDTTQVTILDRMAPTVFISRDHLDYRTRNLVLILVEARVGLELYDTLGFRKIDLGASG